MRNTTFHSIQVLLLRFAAQIILYVHHGLLRLARFLVPPQLTLLEQIGGVVNTKLIFVAAHLKIADLLAIEPMRASAIAIRLHLDPDATHRLLRSLATLGIFKLLPDGRFKNNRHSRVLLSQSKDTLRDFALYFGSQSNMDAWSDFLSTVQTGQNYFERRHQMSVWAWFNLHPHEGKVFTQAMMNLTRMDASILAQAYPFAEGQKLCDIAGGRGILLSEILLRHSHLQAILYDEKYVLEEAQTFFVSLGLASKLELVEGNFFENIPSGCDIYIIKDILHDWDDERCIKILRQIRKNLDAKARLLVIEVLVNSLTICGPGPLMDIHMMTVCPGGRQRSKQDLCSLFEKSGLRMRRIFLTPSPFSIVEATI